MMGAVDKEESLFVNSVAATRFALRRYFYLCIRLGNLTYMVNYSQLW
jgi:hypothetical protein